MPPIPERKRIVITGASSGLGAALAQLYAAPGRKLGLIGRNETRLAAGAALCRDAGAEVDAAALDVGEADPLAAWLGEFGRDGPIDLVIANAGTSAGPAPARAAWQGASTNSRRPAGRSPSRCSAPPRSSARSSSGTTWRASREW